MAGEWEETTVGDLVKRGVLERPLDGNHGSIHPKGDDFVATGVPFIMASDLVGGGIDTVNCSFISIEQAKSLRKGFAKRGDVLISHKATLGRTALVGEIPGDFVMLTPQVTYYRPKDATKLNNRYLKYYFDSEQFQQVLQSWAGAGSTRAYIGITDQLRLPVILPPLAEQKAIAAVLGALDDKIELNRRMNATLEAMARALFQSWFVDFDPVRAKLDGRPPAALAPATAALFPDSFQDSPLGHIPTGWETSTIGAKLQTALGGTPSRAKPEFWTDGTVAWINSGKTNEFRIIEPSEWITKEALENSATKLLPRRTTVLAITGATLGQVSITEIECCANQSVVAILASEQFPTEFIYPWIEENIEKLIASQTGGAQQHINKGNVEELALLCPESRIVAAYQTKAKPLFDQISANCFQSRTLATLRDTLLPKLLSGELSVMDEGRQIERATLWKPQLAPPTS